MGLVTLGRQIHSAEPLVLEPSAVKFYMALAKLKRHKSQCTEQIPTELIKVGERKIRSEIHKLINPLPVLFKTLLHGQKVRVFSVGI